jgi:amidase
VANAIDGTTTGPSEVAGVSVDPAIGWALTYPVNFTGHPAASVPAGLDADGLPVGLQIIGRRFRDEDVLSVAAALEQIRPWDHHLTAIQTGDTA